MTKCNGWANRETWLVNLWFGDYIPELIEGESVTADDIREMVASHVDHVLGRGQMSDGFIRDMLDLGAIDYQELADHYSDSKEQG